MPKFLYLLTDYPMLIAAPIILFAGFALWSHSRTAWVATAAWNAYLIYELGMRGGIFCSDECVKRTPLYVAYPLLAFLSFVALVRVYVWIRDIRPQEQWKRSIAKAHRAAYGRKADGS